MDFVMNPKDEADFKSFRTRAKRDFNEEIALKYKPGKEDGTQGGNRP
jgi:hypothetical protein